MSKWNTKPLPDEGCGQLAEEGPFVILQSSRTAGSCNGCLGNGHAGKVWELRLKGLLVRLCDECFDKLESQRKRDKK